MSDQDRIDMGIIRVFVYADWHRRDPVVHEIEVDPLLAIVAAGILVIIPDARLGFCADAPSCNDETGKTRCAELCLEGTMLCSDGTRSPSTQVFHDLFVIEAPAGQKVADVNWNEFIVAAQRSVGIDMLLLRNRG